MPKFIFILAATSALAGTAAFTAQPARTAPAPTSRPTFGTFGFDESGMDRSVAPGDDFYDYANGTWAKRTSIPADKAAYGMFTLLDDLSRDRTRTILEQAERDPGSKIGNAYTAFLDTRTIEARGLAPMRPWLDRINRLESKAGYAALVAEAARIGIGGPVAAFVNQDDKEPNQYALNLAQAGLGMPDRDYYLRDDPKIAQTRTAYQQHLEKMLTLAGENNGGTGGNDAERLGG